MDDIERRLRAALARSAEPAPPGLLSRVYSRHRRRRRRAIAGYAAVAAAVLAVGPATGELGTGTHQAGSSGSGQSAVSGRPGATARPVVAAPGTILLTCRDANWGQLSPQWRSGSFDAGPVWFVFGRQQGFVHDRDYAGRGSAYRPRGGNSGDVMVLEVANGATVTIKPAAAARPYVRFFDGFDGPRPGQLPAGDTGLTIAACPRAERGPNGHFTDYYLGFSVLARHTAAVNIWVDHNARPLQVIFTCPVSGGPCASRL